MQLELNIEKSKPMIKKKVNLEFIQLTQRDLEIISFVCDMKFASLDDIYEKYFKKLKDGTLSKSTWWARQRLNELFKHKYLNRIYSFSERKAYYLGTLKGYLEIVKKCPFSLLFCPSRGDTVSRGEFKSKTLLKMSLPVPSVFFSVLELYV